MRIYEHKLGRKCPICGKDIVDNSKTGYCVKHRPRNGVNNPFFGKHQKPITEETRKKLSEKAKQAWQNSEYRKKVIEGATGKKRSEEFKQGQREHALKQMQDPKQRSVRAQSMKKNWESGKISAHEQYHVSRSAAEKELYEKLSEYFGTRFIDRQSISYVDETGKKRWIFPDGRVFGKVVVEYNGNYHHGNPFIYESTDKIGFSGLTAAEVQEKDRERYEKLNSLGYSVIVVWESAWKRDKQKCLDKVISLLDWENVEDCYVYEFQ